MGRGPPRRGTTAETKEGLLVWEPAMKPGKPTSFQAKHGGGCPHRHCPFAGGEHKVTWEDLGVGSSEEAVSPSPQRADDASEGQRKEGKAPGLTPSLIWLDVGE